MDPGIQPVSIGERGLEWKFRLHAPRQPGPGQVEVLHCQTIFFIFGPIREAIVPFICFFGFFLFRHLFILFIESTL